MHLRVTTAILALLCGATAARAQSIILDGSFDDWTAIKPAIIDPADAPRQSFVDFRAASASADGAFVHLFIDFGRPVNIQRLPGSIYIMIDVDGDESTGRKMFDLPGADLAVMLTAPNAKRPNEPGGGIAVESATWKPSPEEAHEPSGMISPYAVGFTFAPTYLSKHVEMRLRRGAHVTNTPALFTGSRFGVALVAMDANKNILDQTKPAYIDLPQLKSDADTLASTHQSNGDSANPLSKPAAADFRAVNWNVEFSALVQQPQNFMPVLRALDPDILLFQELDERTSADDIARLLNDNVSSNNRSWTVLIGAGGGNLRCAVASRLPVQQITGIEPLTYPDDPARTTRHAAALVKQGDHAILFTSIHLRCCGAADTHEEDVRLMEVQILNAALRSALRATKSNALIIAGDFNLVGARKPLELLSANLDLDRSDLDVAQPFQLDGRSNATWADPDQPYVPGRLDYVLFTGASLNAVNAFVFDAQDLPPAIGKQFGFDPGMTGRASDHLPVVVDFQWAREDR